MFKATTESKLSIGIALVGLGLGFELAEVMVELDQRNAVKLWATNTI